ncbi:MAG: hypothetical protein AAGM67_13835 [Bacteroidota bacterium]
MVTTHTGSAAKIYMGEGIPHGSLRAQRAHRRYITRNLYEKTLGKTAPPYVQAHPKVGQKDGQKR